MQRLRVAYNFGCRALYNLPWRASVGSHQVQCNIPTFRRRTYDLTARSFSSNQAHSQGISLHVATPVSY